MAWQPPAAGPDDRGPIENNETVRSVEQTNQETTKERVIVIHQLLNDLYKQFGQPLPYLEFVIHPQSFGKTCENIFRLSLLIEGHARIKNDESNLLVVEPIFKNTSTQREANENVFVMTLDFKKWQGAVEALKITKPVILN
ncbi:non-structural maintenance of chromosomes element 4 homolog A-like [Dermacentor silvarum]|uniref:non-structural maintenance of chromosomes element 4 homolog A-like n=1 Tax=Dermacentor silvarum TaxID=543639 RepID=UPI001897198D|nr:non-structural maintenance of chromosomes element 4 homolog A-like [Dermacentor silvarum]